MKPVFQTTFGLDWTKPDAGNCLQACLASVLELPLEDVPHFVVQEDHHGEMNRWLRKHHGLYVVCFPTEGGAVPWVEGIYLEQGLGARGAEHIVVMRDDEMIHDPIGPEGPGLEQPKTVWLFVAPDPARWKEITG